MEGLFGFPNIQFIAFLLALIGIADIAPFVYRCLVLGVDQSLSEGVGGFVLPRDVVFLEDSPEFFWKSRQIWDGNAVPFISLLFFLGVSFSGGLGEGPVWVATGAVLRCPCSFFVPWDVVGTSLAQCCGVLMTPSLCSSGWCGSKRRYWSLWRFSIDLDAEVSVLLKPDCTAQEVQAVFFYIFSGEFDIFICIVEVGWECLQFSCLNIDPGLIYVSELVAWDGSCERRQNLAFHLLHVEVGNYGGNRWTHCTT